MMFSCPAMDGICAGEGRLTSVLQPSTPAEDCTRDERTYRKQPGTTGARLLLDGGRLPDMRATPARLRKAQQ